MVDDHLGIAIDRAHLKTNALKVARSFEAARSGYEREHLRVSADKALDGATSGIVVGTEILGEEGHAAAPRARRWQLADVTLALIKQRRTTGRIMRKLLST